MFWPLPGLGERVEVGVRLWTRPGSECEIPGWEAEQEAPLDLKSHSENPNNSEDSASSLHLLSGLVGVRSSTRPLFPFPPLSGLREAGPELREQRQERGSRMNVGTAHSEVNPNTRVMNSRGIWLSYVLAIGLLHVVLLSIPFVSVPVVWTLTNLIHNMGMYIFLHTVKGTPFETPDQGKARLLTHWEQMDYGVQFTASRKFLTITPIVLYFLTSFYTKYDQIHFILNTVSLMSVLIPKLPQLHGVRIFGINKY